MRRLLLVLFAVFALFSSQALADPLFNVCDNSKTSAAAANSAVCQSRGTQAGGTNPLNHYIHVGATIIASIAGVAAIILVIVSAFKFVSGGGSPESVKSARATLIAALIGLVIVSLAWTIISFLTDKFIK